MIPQKHNIWQHLKIQNPETLHRHLQQQQLQHSAQLHQHQQHQPQQHPGPGPGPPPPPPRCWCRCSGTRAPRHSASASPPWHTPWLESIPHPYKLKIIRLLQFWQQCTVAALSHFCSNDSRSSPVFYFFCPLVRFFFCVSEFWWLLTATWEWEIAKMPWKDLYLSMYINVKIEVESSRNHTIIELWGNVCYSCNALLAAHRSWLKMKTDWRNAIVTKNQIQIFRIQK